jgi:signal peptidase I
LSDETSIEQAAPPIDVKDSPCAVPTNDSGVLSMLQSLARIVTIALFLLTFIVQPFRIPSASMERTLLVGDFLLVNKQIYGPPGFWSSLLPYRNIQRGEIIVFHFPSDPATHLVKRVVAIPGDRIRLHNGRVFINGVSQQEPYAIFRPSWPDNYRDNFPQMDEADPAIKTRWWIQMRSLVRDGELTVPPGNYFAMGDNRNDSEDSRYWGFVPRENIVGEPLLIYLSLREPDTEETLPHLPAPTAPESLLDKARWSRILHVIR